MTYDATKLNLIKSGLNAGPALWDYTSGDAHGTVEGASFFSDGVKHGMKVGDKVIVSNSASNYDTTIHAVKSVSGNACTIGAALLA